MVSEIEKEWKRPSGDVYEGLLMIHDAQTLSAKQIAKGSKVPNKEFLTYVSAYKGGASVVRIFFRPL